MPFAGGPVHHYQVVAGSAGGHVHGGLVLVQALGNVLAPWVAGAAAGGDFNQVFLRIALITAAGGVVLLLLVPVLKRMMHGVK